MGIFSFDDDGPMLGNPPPLTPEMEREYEKIAGAIKQNAASLNPMGFVAPGMLTPVRDSKHGETKG